MRQTRDSRYPDRLWCIEIEGKDTENPMVKVSVTSRRRETERENWNCYPGSVNHMFFYMIEELETGCKVEDAVPTIQFPEKIKLSGIEIKWINEEMKVYTPHGWQYSFYEKPVRKRKSGGGGGGGRRSTRPAATDKVAKTMNAFTTKHLYELAVELKLNVDASADKRTLVEAIYDSGNYEYQDVRDLMNDKVWGKVKKK